MSYSNFNHNKKSLELSKRLGAVNAVHTFFFTKLYKLVTFLITCTV